MGIKQPEHVRNVMITVMSAVVLFGSVIVFAFQWSSTRKTNVTTNAQVQPVAKQMVVPKPTVSSNGLVLYTSEDIKGEVIRTVFVKNVFFCVERNLIMQSAFINSAPKYTGTNVTNSSTVIAKYDTEEICKSTAAKQ